MREVVRRFGGVAVIFCFSFMCDVKIAAGLRGWVYFPDCPNNADDLQISSCSSCSCAQSSATSKAGQLAGLNLLSQDTGSKTLLQLQSALVYNQLARQFPEWQQNIQQTGISLGQPDLYQYQPQVIDSRMQFQQMGTNADIQIPQAYQETGDGEWIRRQVTNDVLQSNSYGALQERNELAGTYFQQLGNQINNIEQAKMNQFFQPENRLQESLYPYGTSKERNAIQSLAGTYSQELGTQPYSIQQAQINQFVQPDNRLKESFYSLGMLQEGNNEMQSQAGIYSQGSSGLQVQMNDLYQYPPQVVDSREQFQQIRNFADIQIPQAYQSTGDSRRIRRQVLADASQFNSQQTLQERDALQTGLYSQQLRAQPYNILQTQMNQFTQPANSFQESLYPYRTIQESNAMMSQAGMYSQELGNQAYGIQQDQTLQNRNTLADVYDQSIGAQSYNAQLAQVNALFGLKNGFQESFHPYGTLQENNNAMQSKVGLFSQESSGQAYGVQQAQNNYLYQYHPQVADSRERFQQISNFAGIQIPQAYQSTEDRKRIRRQVLADASQFNSQEVLRKRNAMQTGLYFQQLGAQPYNIQQTQMNQFTQPANSFQESLHPYRTLQERSAMMPQAGMYSQILGNQADGFQQAQMNQITPPKNWFPESLYPFRTLQTRNTLADVYDQSIGAQSYNAQLAQANQFFGPKTLFQESFYPYGTLQERTNAMQSKAGVFSQESSGQAYGVQQAKINDLYQYHPQAADIRERFQQIRNFADIQIPQGLQIAEDRRRIRRQVLADASQFNSQQTLQERNAIQTGLYSQQLGAQPYNIPQAQMNQFTQPANSFQESLYPYRPLQERNAMMSQAGAFSQILGDQAYGIQQAQMNQFTQPANSFQGSPYPYRTLQNRNTLTDVYGQSVGAQTHNAQLAQTNELFGLKNGFQESIYPYGSYSKGILMESFNPQSMSNQQYGVQQMSINPVIEPLISYPETMYAYTSYPVRTMMQSQDWLHSQTNEAQQYNALQLQASQYAASQNELPEFLSCASAFWPNAFPNICSNLFSCFISLYSMMNTFLAGLSSQRSTYCYPYQYTEDFCRCVPLCATSCQQVEPMSMPAPLPVLLPPPLPAPLPAARPASQWMNLDQLKARLAGYRSLGEPQNPAKAPPIVTETVVGTSTAGSVARKLEIETISSTPFSALSTSPSILPVASTEKFPAPEAATTTELASTTQVQETPAPPSIVPPETAPASTVPATSASPSPSEASFPPILAVTSPPVLEPAILTPVIMAPKPIKASRSLDD